MYDFRENMGLVCHDAGAANVLIAAFRRNPPSSFMVLMKGPAKYIWENTFPDIACDYPLNEMISKATCIFTGSGWATSLEFDAIKLARERGLFCTAVLDHWVNYEQRFNRNGLKVWPDCFLVTDSEAYKLACLTFPPENIVQCENFYLEDQINRITSKDETNEKQLLYICEPMRNTWGRDQDGEFQVLDYFLETIEKLQIPNSYKILLRPHPSESFVKYDLAISKSQIPIEVSKNRDIAEDIGKSSAVFGCNSYGMVISLAANKATYNVLPPWAPPSILPHMNIKPLTELRLK
jgi:hypothetical protein